MNETHVRSVTQDSAYLDAPADERADYDEAEAQALGVPISITAADVQRVATSGHPCGELTRDDLIAMTEPGDWTGDWDALTPEAAELIAADLNERSA